MSTDTSEKSYQKDIHTYLVSTGYVKRTTADYNVNTCLDMELVFKFIQSTQPKAWNKFKKAHGEEAHKRFIDSLSRKIRNNGTIDVLRNGFRDITHFDFFYPKPNNNLNPESEEKYNKNIYSVIDELEYENRENGNRLDLVIFINGIPISTIELKDTFSQGVDKAIKQYKLDRDPREQLFKNCLVHFAMSDESIYMTTKLEGLKTDFLPFNKGITNPDVKDNYRTSYLYTDILQPNQLSRLINNFIFVEGDKVIFPRFHQFDCVNQLLKGPVVGKNYLVQHSAGSGKTKTIAWLAHGLLNQFDENDKRIYDMVIVISDRTVIDDQLQKQIKSFERREGVVKKIEKDSNELAEAILSGKNIIVTTLQKFSYILEKVQDLESRKYAIIVDEAHSSQTGSHSNALRTVLSDSINIDEDELDDAEDDIEEEIIKELEKRRKTANLSFFAFTATPKNKTLEMFGLKNEYGQFVPHHVYSMKQAIHEGFILDVLKHYINYPTYFQLVKTVQDDPILDQKKAKRVLKKFVELHEHAIKEKTAIILDHYMNSSIHKINNHARAMLVTSSRKHAVLYKLEIDRQIKESNLPIKALVAFTGTVHHDTEDYTEGSMNDIGNEEIKAAFRKDPYKILIVANKFQTGFDEPLLHTMYVDKKLDGVAAVQTLSRVNRTYPGKKDTLILDFANGPDTIKDAFEPYYNVTYLSEETDYRVLYDLMENIYSFCLFDEDDVDKFVKNYKKGRPQSQLHNLMNVAVDRFKEMDDEDQDAFKRKLRKYQNIYSFLSQLLPFSDVALEKLYIYNKFLYKKLPLKNTQLPKYILEDVDMDSYKVDTGKEEGSISLSEGLGELNPTSGTDTVPSPDELETLSKIIEDLNERFSTEFSEDDRVPLRHLRDKLIENEDLSKKVKNNPKESVAEVFDEYFDNELDDLFNSYVDFYKKVNDNDSLKGRLKDQLLNLIYKEQKVSVQ